MPVDGTDWLATGVWMVVTAVVFLTAVVGAAHLVDRYQRRRAKADRHQVSS